MSETLRAEITLVDDKVRFRAECAEKDPFFVMATQRLGIRIDHIAAVIEGDRRKQHPTSLEEVWITLCVDAEGSLRESLIEVMRNAEEKICPVFDMVRGNCRITTELRMGPALLPSGRA